MSIIQISKLQQRAGNLVDLPQLDDAEFGWASDQKRLFIGKTTPNENVEVLTSYSSIAFNQIDGSIGNLNVSPTTLATGQVLAFNGTDWVNTGTGAGGLLTLGDVGNVKIDGGAIGFVLQTDGAGNLSWTPKATIVANIQNVTKANPAVVTTVSSHYFVKGAQITVTNAQGMTQLNGNAYYVQPLTSNTFSLYSDSGLTSTINSSAYTAYAYTTATATTVGTNQITVGSSSSFTANSAVQFIGNMAGTGITANTTYYVLGSPPDGTHIKIATSPDSNTSNVVPLQSASITANVYQLGGQAVSSAGATSFVGNAAGSNTAIQYANSTGQFGASSNFTFDYATNILTVTGNANVSNLNSTNNVVASRLVSNVATGTSPIQVTSTTRVANLNVAYSNVSDYSNVVAQTTGTFYPVFSSGSANANYQLGVNANISFNALTGNLTTQLLNVVSNANVGNIGATNGVFTANITGGNANVSGQLISRVATGTAPLVVTSTTQVPNLFAARSNVSTYDTVSVATSGVYYPELVSGTTAGNYSPYTNSAFTFNTSTGSFGATLLNITGNANVGNIGANRVVANTISGSLITAAQPNITSVSTSFTGLTLIANGDITMSGADSQLTGANLVSASFLSGTLTTTDQPNITSIGTLTTAIVTGNILAGNVYANSGTIGASLLTGILTTGAQPNITSLGSLGSLTVTSNISSGNLSAGSITSSNLTVNSNIAAGNISVSRDISVAGNSNVSGNLIVVNNVSANNVTTISEVNVGGNAIVTGNVRALGNIIGSRNLTVTGNITATANISASFGSFSGNITSLNANLGNLVKANYFQGDGGLLTNISVATGTLIQNGSSNVIVDYNYAVRIGSSGTANVITIYGAGANISGYANITGNANVGNLGTNRLIATGNISGTDIAGTGNLSILGNTSIIGNVAINRNATLSGNITVSNARVNSNLSVLGDTTTSGNTSTSANLTVGSSAIIAGTISVVGNASLGNVAATNGTFTNTVTANSQFTNLRDVFNNLVTKFDNDGTMAANSSQYLATQQAVVSYVQNAIYAIAQSAVPVGSVFYVAMSTPPAGYIIANGASVLRSTYPNLSAALGNTYGGNVTNFNIPDLRGQFIRGFDDGRGIDPSRQFGSNQTDDFKSHTHTGYAGYDFPTSGYTYSYEEGRGYPDWRAAPIGATGGSETRPTNVALLPIIKF